MKVVREISEKNVESEADTTDGAESEDGEAEVVALARRCLEIGAGERSSDSQSGGGGIVSQKT